MSAKPGYSELAEKIKALEHQLSMLQRGDHDRFIQAIADTTPTALYIYDFEMHRNVWANAAHREVIGPLLGTDPAGARLEDVFALLHPEDVDQLTGCVEHLKRQQVARCEEVAYRLRSKEGQWRWFADRISVFKRRPDGELQQILGAATDITQRRRAEDALRESEERFRRLFEEVPAAIQGYGPDGTIHYWNRASESIYGYTKEEAIGRNLVELIIPPDMRKDVAAVMRHGAGTGLMPPPQEYWLMHKDGSLIPVLSNHVVIRHADKPAELYCLDVDLKEQKRLQSKLRQRHKMEAIGTLTGGVAHDFNNILGIIIGYTELAMEDIPSWSPAYFKLEEIKTASLRARQIVAQLLAFSCKSGRQRRPTRLIPALKEAVKLLRSTIPATVEFREHYEATEDMILSEPALIHQIAINLGSNAAHAMEETGGILTIGLENVVLDEAAAKAYEDLSEGQYIKWSVSDTGTGIDPRDIDRIFDPYFTTKAIGKGSGMGLAMVHGIVKDHNGAVSIASQPGKGATFTILLPLTGDAPADEAQPAESLPAGKE